MEYASKNLPQRPVNNIESLKLITFSFIKSHIVDN